MIHSSFPGCYENLEKICNLVTDQAKRAGFDESAVYAIQTAVDEACSNIIEHSYGEEGRGNIDVFVTTENECITIQLIDHGEPFNPETIPEPNIIGTIHQREAHGLGLYFMRKLMDEVRFSFSEDSGNMVTMVKCQHHQC